MDIIYLVRSGDVNEDLRTSLRSIDKFAPDFDKIYLIGYTPEWANNIISVETEQYDTSWRNAFNNLITACNTESISDDFILMNDDFVLTRKIENWENSICKVCNTIKEQISRYKDENLNSNYTKAFTKTLNLFDNIDIYNYELHIPMIINKKKFLELFSKPDMIEFIKNNPIVLYRSIYGNYYGIDYNEIIEDVKFRYGDPKEITTEWISVFDGWIGNKEKYPVLNKFLNSLFNNPSKYEKRIVKLYDHETHPIWNDLYQKRHESKNRTNGGYTYSQNIVKFHIPVILEVLNKSKYKNIVITTVGMVENIVNYNTDLVICYLHEELDREYPRILNVKEVYKGDIIYVCSRKDVYNKLTSNNIKCVFIPMSIDTSEFVKYAKSEKYADKRVLYFGNKYLDKGKLFTETKQAFIKAGWIFDEISNNIFNNNGNILNRDELLEIVSKYKYGVAGGRCALEMNAMGIKTMICLEKNQGIWTNEEEFNLHAEDNFAGKELWTFSDNISTVINSFDKAMVKTIDVHEVLPLLKEQLERVLL